MTKRREFIKQVAVAGIASSIPSVLFPQQKPSQNMIWANLLHLSNNMWGDYVPEEFKNENFPCTSCEDVKLWAYWYRPDLVFDDAMWNILLKYMADIGMNMVIIDLGDAVLYESHPEIAVKNAWTPAKLKKELVKIRKLGLEPIPKLNFSAGHDSWLGIYSRMVSTDKYYGICKDLIEEVIALFDKPRFFHLGMDEETASNQTKRNYVVVRQNDLWWNDFYFLMDVVEKNFSRPWIWSDYIWHHPDEFFKKMPKSVLQSNWYYGKDFIADAKYVKYYEELDKHGYEQVPTGSNHFNSDNFQLTVDFCKKNIDPSRLLGFMNTTWRPTLMPCLERHKEAIDQVARAIKIMKQ
jgi:hypothetical protein